MQAASNTERSCPNLASPTFQTIHIAGIPDDDRVEVWKEGERIDEYWQAFVRSHPPDEKRQRRIADAEASPQGVRGRARSEHRIDGWRDRSDAVRIDSDAL